MAPLSGRPRSASQVRRSFVKHSQPPDTTDSAYQVFVSMKIDGNKGVICGAVEQKRR